MNYSYKPSHEDLHTDQPKNDKSPVVANKISIFRRLMSLFIRVITFPILLVMRFLYLIQQLLNWIRFRYIEFITYPDDIYIVTYPRSGTTWMQMILYQLTSNGELEFNHISEKIPWFERFVRYEETIPKLKPPRIFKSHLRYSGFNSIPKGMSRYIYITRNLSDVLVSYYHFYVSHMGFKGTFDQFFNLFMAGRVRYGSWFDHIRDWVANPKHLNILFIRYEDLSNNLEAEIRKIADFCDITFPEEKLADILERCSFTYMKRYQEKFDYIAEVLLEMGIDNKSFIRSGRVGTSKEILSESQQSQIKKSIDGLPPQIQKVINEINKIDTKLENQTEVENQSVESLQQEKIYE